MKRLMVVMLAAACGGGPTASPEEIARFVGEWNGGATIQGTCGTVPQSPIGGAVTIPLGRGTDADLQYTSSGGCLFKFRVAGNTASLSNAPVKCALDSANVAFSEYTLTTTDGVHATLNAAGAVTDGGGSCRFTMTGSLCSGPLAVCNPTPPPPQPPTLEIVSGGDQTGVVGTALSMPVRVRVRAADGTPVVGQYVGFAVEQGGGSVSASFRWSVGDGIAEVSWTLGTTAQLPQTLVATIEGVAPLRVSATAVAGPARTLTIASSPAEVLIGNTVQLTVSGLDAYGNVTSAPGSPVWTSGDPNVIAVSDTGIATGMKFGSSQIGASIGEISGFRNYMVEGLLSGTGTATIDGVLASGEWDHATSAALLVNVPEGTTPGRLYVMNDDTDLYLALSFARSTVDAVSNLSSALDSNGDHAPSNGDDAMAVDGASNFSDLTLVSCGAELCSHSDSDLGGSIDGSGVIHNDGSITVYELRHPLNSLDPHDVALSHGSRIGVQMSLGLQQADGAFQGTWYPDPTKYLQVTIR